ncbi:cation diffusion facilitator family transporter [Sphingobium sufflavum]|uniref:cation diffusion facilitator family transporter n=1 Tax=Sphingobium sufflavum TaxID=1129547 RepID=UPI001F447877|nr:cation diffusion facilitator family transporter [Sphingobium sufflavum]MCE7795738.1 cation diffusion facilitator family transporter [Sphingobium sufflavum]
MAADHPAPHGHSACNGVSGGDSGGESHGFSHDHDHGEGGAHHGHDHSHGHHGHHHGGHGHSHAPASFGRAFAIGITLNIAFVLVEGGFGLLSGSLALVADAGHNLSDVFGLLVAWGAVALGKVRPSGRFTYGLRGSSILAALLNGLLLMLAAGAIALAAVQRFGDPQPVMGGTMMAVAGVGILINGATAWLFMAGAKGDINIRGAFLHMLADALVSAGVVVAGLAIGFTGWLWIDPVTSLLIVAVIVWSSWGLLKEAVALSLGAVPAGIDAGAVERHLAALPGVTAVHDLHIWPMSTTETAMTAHLVMPDGAGRDAFLLTVAEAMRQRFGIGHTTIQVEQDAAACTLGEARLV